MQKKCFLSDILPGQRATVKALLSHDGMRRRLMDIGLVPETKVECVGQSPAGDPKAYLIRGAVIAIRNDDASDIFIKEE